MDKVWRIWKSFFSKKIITEKEYAIKQIDTSNFSTEEVYNISRENLILRTMNHKNVIKLYDSFIYNKKFYTVMDYARGGELTVLLEGKEGNKNNILTEKETKQIFKQIYDGVRYIHERNIIHRDLKPSNILFLDEEKTHVVIIDFGISGFSNGNNREKIKAGTTMFLAPETACGKEYSSNRKLDIWALGIILYRMVEGIYPFDGKNCKEVINNIMKKNLEFNKKIKISKPMKNLIGGMLEKNHRFRIDDDSELFNKWFDFNPIKKTSTIIINNTTKDSFFENINESNDSINNIINQDNNKFNNNNNNLNSPYSKIARDRSHKNNNKYKLLSNMNNIEKKVGFKQLDLEIKTKSKYSKFKKIIQNLNVINVISSSNNHDIKKNNKNKKLILPELNTNKIKLKEIFSPFKTKIDMKKNSILKPIFPIYGSNLFKNKYDIKNDMNKNTLILNMNECINKNNGYSSNYTCRKRATSDFKNEILQTIYGNNIVNNKNNSKNSVNENKPNTFKNINITSFNKSPIKRNKFKSLGRISKNISSYEIDKFPIIID